MTFFTDSGNQSFPTNRVTRVIGSYNNEPLVELDDGSTVSISSNTANRLVDPIVSSFPSQPGTLLFSENREADGGLIIWPEPILGWAVTTGGNVIPLTANGAEDGMTSEYAVQMPNGSVTAPHERSWSSLGAYLQDRQAKLGHV